MRRLLSEARARVAESHAYLSLRCSALDRWRQRTAANACLFGLWRLLLQLTARELLETWRRAAADRAAAGFYLAGGLASLRRTLHRNAMRHVVAGWRAAATDWPQRRRKRPLERLLRGKEAVARDTTRHALRAARRRALRRWRAAVATRWGARSLTRALWGIGAAAARCLSAARCLRLWRAALARTAEARMLRKMSRALVESQVRDLWVRPELRMYYPTHTQRAEVTLRTSLLGVR